MTVEPTPPILATLLELLLGAGSASFAIVPTRTPMQPLGGVQGWRVGGFRVDGSVLGKTPKDAMAMQGPELHNLH